MTQPWVIGPVPTDHTVHLRFTVHCAQDIPNVKLALEDADVATIRLNGQPVTARADGWFCDKSIHTVPLGTLPQGKNSIEVDLPYGMRTCVEWHYLLGDFGVNVYGEYRELTAQPEYLGFDNVVNQGLAHYGSNITYRFPVTTSGGKLAITIPHYAGAAILVKAGDAEGCVLYPPYRTELDLCAGTHELELKLLGYRENCFGPIHNADPAAIYVRPGYWRTEGNAWTYSYRLKPLGILSAPRIEELQP